MLWWRIVDPKLVLDARAELGEGPSWSARQGRLYWVDIHAGNLHYFAPEDGSDSVLSMGEPIGCVVPATDGTVVAALTSGFVRVDTATGTRTPLARLDSEPPRNRFNDGKCDSQGRFLAGTMDDAEKEASGSLYSLAPDGALKRLLSGLRISNGLAWSPDGSAFYFIDTPTREIRAFEYDLSGDINNPRAVARVPEELGYPDGMTSDSEGMLWVGMWGGACITRWDPTTGELLGKVPVPALNVTSCVFGGPELKDLYVISARKGMTPEELARYPQSGGLFRVATGITGAPTFEFGRK